MNLDDPVLDTTILDQLRQALDAQTVANLIDIFIRDTVPQGQRLRVAHDAADFTALAREAHTLKGAAANIGARGVQRAAAALDAACRAGKAGDFERLTLDVEQALQDAGRALGTYVAAPGRPGA